MTRVDEKILALHLEVALCGAAPSLLDGLATADGHRRHVAVTEMARHLVERLRCFEFRSEEGGRLAQAQPALFPDDLGPIG